MEHNQHIYISPTRLSREQLVAILPTLPTLPGCYQYFDEEGSLIYVGKAKNLRKRISSYFQKELTDRKTKVLVSKIRGLKYIVVDTEAEALILEGNLIKTHQPRYNVLLKDGKTYPSIAITKEHFPRIIFTRDIRKDGTEYFGPYPSAIVAKNMVALLRDLYKFRTCLLNLSPAKIAEGKYKVCLNYHIKKCNAPCIGRVNESDYLHSIDEARELLKGNLSLLMKIYRGEMIAASEQMRYEQAQVYKERLALLKRYEAKHTVAPRAIMLVDVFSYDEDQQQAYINYMQVSEGMIRLTNTVEYRKRVDEEPDEIFARAIAELRDRYQSMAREIILPFDPGWGAAQQAKITIPQRGDKKHLLDLSERNVRQYKIDCLKQAEKLNAEQSAARLMKQMMKDLHLDREPRLIHCFDNSNIQGTSPVAACTVFKNGKPAKSEYRKFHVKTVVGADDYASMREIVGRRYSRILKEENSEEKLPDLIVIDGGKGQLRVAYEVLRELDLVGKIPIIGLAERVEEVYYPNDPVPLTLGFNSESLRVLRQIRDEAHRFGITFHRQTRGKAQVKSELDNIKGIGHNSKTNLLRHFKSVKRIREATEEEIASIVGPSRAKKIRSALQADRNISSMES